MPAGLSITDRAQAKLKTNEKGYPGTLAIARSNHDDFSHWRPGSQAAALVAVFASNCDYFTCAVGVWATIFAKNGNALFSSSSN
jgi:hypothetical protein